MAEQPPCARAKPSPSAVRRAICREALALARHADDVGLAVPAGLLRLAALQAISDFQYLHEADCPTGRAFRGHRMPDEPEALIAWFVQHILKD
jgi:hypothetical protein